MFVISIKSASAPGLSAFLETTKGHRSTFQAKGFETKEDAELFLAVTRSKTRYYAPEIIGQTFNERLMKAEILSADQCRSDLKVI